MNIEWFWWRFVVVEWSGIFKVAPSRPAWRCCKKFSQPARRGYLNVNEKEIPQDWGFPAHAKWNFAAGRREAEMSRLCYVCLLSFSFSFHSSDHMILPKLLRPQRRTQEFWVEFPPGISKKLKPRSKITHWNFNNHESFSVSGELQFLWVVLLITFW
jgi:hypothetical protein